MRWPIAPSSAGMSGRSPGVSSRIKLKAAADTRLYSFVEQRVAGEDARSARYDDIHERRHDRHLPDRRSEVLPRHPREPPARQRVECLKLDRRYRRRHRRRAPTSSTPRRPTAITTRRSRAGGDRDDAVRLALRPQPDGRADGRARRRSPTMSPPTMSVRHARDPGFGGDGTTYPNACRADAAGVAFVPGACAGTQALSFNITSGAAPRTTSAALAAAVAVLAA